MPPTTSPDTLSINFTSIAKEMVHTCDNFVDFVHFSIKMAIVEPITILYNKQIFSNF